ncbi:URC4/urg3 family protein [Variovorax sp. PAMC26660]|uniref:URC4/urg3 family protein n=1 Tax=Variovorax sp. PAMC26660 TaxID=2762322 RepID=UPI00164E2937|nr:URC4/urg3 family protein [Variovorax sp. PAMC26660]QNK67731.1 URC4/urg3 family protein [Variovorax sp. PAMC26660]
MTTSHNTDPHMPVDGSGSLPPGGAGKVDPSIEFTADASHPAGAASLLRTTAAIRQRAGALLARARNGESQWFRIGGDDMLEDAARTVAEVTRERYPWDTIPYHSRWRHFEAGGVDRIEELNTRLGALDARQRARAHIDLVLVSVLLDAGAGPDWHYIESATGERFTRSEGLGVASFHAFMSGMFSSDPNHPYQVDADGLRGLVADRLGDAFQVSEVNPLVGLAGRATLLRRLGEAMNEQPEIFGDDGRPGRLFDALVGPYGPAAPPTAEITAHQILSLLLDSLSRIWPSANAVDSIAADGSDNAGGIGSSDPALALGDCWRHSAVRGPGLTNGWMPFHKLSQWLTYSLLEPFEWAGVKVRHLDALTALPEYRNGGLLIDSGVIVPRDPAFLTRRWKASDEFIVEWRALTVALLDEVAPRVRKVLNRTAEELPLACILEGGTWAAGRALAQRLRNGAPPLLIESDGTVF